MDEYADIDQRERLLQFAGDAAVCLGRFGDAARMIAFRRSASFTTSRGYTVAPSIVPRRPVPQISRRRDEARGLRDVAVRAMRQVSISMNAADSWPSSVLVPINSGPSLPPQ